MGRRERVSAGPRKHQKANAPMQAALDLCLSMISSENRFPLFRIML
jgi:hypothetical protein